MKQCSTNVTGYIYSPGGELIAKVNYCNQNTNQVCNFDPIKVPLPREEVNEESSIFEKILLWLEDRVNELNDLLSMILE